MDLNPPTRSETLSQNAANYRASITANIVDFDPEEVPSEDARDFCVGTGPDGEPLVHAPQVCD